MQAMFIGEGLLTDAAGSVTPADFSNLIPCNFGASVGFSGLRSFVSRKPKNAMGMQFVLRRRCDLKVLDPVVILDAVLVVDLHALWDRSDEDLVNKSMGVEHSPMATVCRKSVASVSSQIGGLANASRLCA